MTEMGFSQQMLRIPWRELVRNNEVLKRLGTSINNQKETTEIYEAHDEESKLGEFNIQNAY